VRLQKRRKNVSTVQLVTDVKFSVAEQRAAFVRPFFLMVRNVN